MKNVLYLTILAFLCVMGLQAQGKRPCSFENVINRTTSLTSYDKYNTNLDLLQVLRYVKDDFLHSLQLLKAKWERIYMMLKGLVP